MLEALLKCLLLFICKCKALENCWKLCRTGWGVVIRRLWFEASVRFSRCLYRSLSNLLVALEPRGARGYELSSHPF